MAKKNKHIGSFLSILNILLIIASLAITINFSFSWAKKKNTFKEPKLILNGSNIYEHKDYFNFIRQISGVDPSKLYPRQILEIIISHPYVQACRVSHRYPNKIIIDIKEREAFAILNKDPLVILDRDCFVLPYNHHLNNLDIPVLSKFNSDNGLYPVGEKSLSIKVQETITWLASLYSQDYDLYSNISEILLENENEIVLILNEYPTKVMLGKNDTMKKIEILKKFEQTIKGTKEITDYAYLDIRYSNQVIAKEIK